MEHTENSELYKLALDDYNNIVDSFEKEETDKTKLYFEFKHSMKTLSKYTETNNRKSLKSAMDVYVII